MFFKKSFGNIGTSYLSNGPISKKKEIDSKAIISDLIELINISVECGFH
jgi:hypothetical protein